MPNRGGRPKKGEKERADLIVKVRFDQEDYKRLMKRKLGTKSRSLSAFIRDACLEKPLLLKVETSSHDEKVLSLLREVRADMLRLGVNINQSVKRINSTTDYQNLQRETQNMTQKMEELEVQFRTLMHIVLTKQQANGSQDQ